MDNDKSKKICKYCAEFKRYTTGGQFAADGTCKSPHNADKVKSVFYDMTCQNFMQCAAFSIKFRDNYK